MSLPREPFSWDDERDQPVPLESVSDDEARVVSSDILSEAETVVRMAQEEIAREDTDPTIEIPPAKDVIKLQAGGPQALTGPANSRSPKGLTILTAIGCVLAFIHGWSAGAGASGRPPPKSCVAHHCQVDPSGNE